MISRRRSSPLRRRSLTPPTHRVSLSPSAYTKLKAKVAAEAGYRCQACGTARHPFGFDLHHVLKRSHGGPDAPENVAYLCKSCHERTDWPYAKGRLVVTPTETGFTFDVVTKVDKWAP